MSPEPESQDRERPESAPGKENANSAAERRRRRAQVFGDVLPDGTSDERGDGWSEREPAEASDEWLRRQVPPHHG